MKKGLKVKIHAAYWIILIPLILIAYGLPYYSSEAVFQDKLIFWIGFPFSTLCTLSEFYWHYSVLVPKYILKETNYLKYGFHSILAWVIFSGFYTLIWQRSPIYYGSFDIQVHFIDKIPALFGTVGFTPVRAIAIRLIEGWADSEITHQRLKKLSIDSKIDFLKTQINPHFVFNTLNNIYALSLKGKPLVIEALKKLQDSFTYLKTVEVNKLVTVKEASDYIQSYIALSKLRIVHPDKVSIHFNVKHQNAKIYPMLLIPLIENAFKHSNLAEKEDEIMIDFSSDENSVKLFVRNTISTKIESKDMQRGIGLLNVQERLKLLFKENDYILSLGVKDDSYEALIKIPYAAI